MDEKQKSVSEDIAKEMMGDKKFCVGIMDCKNRAEVKELLASKGIVANDGDIDNLAKNISEIADICKKLDENELNHIAGGLDGYDVLKGGLVGVGIVGAVASGVGILSVIASWIKKSGDKRNWWNKGAHKK